MTDATKATPLSADIQPKIGEYTSPGVQTPPPAIPQDQVTGKTHGRNPSRARAKSRLSASQHLKRCVICRLGSATTIAIVRRHC